MFRANRAYIASKLAQSPNRPNRAPPDPHLLGVPSGASKTLHRRKYCLKTDRNEIPHDPHHLGVPSGASNTISEPTVRSTQTVLPILHQELHYLQTDRTKLPLEPCHLGVPPSVSKMISMPMVCSVHTVHLSCTDTNTVSKRTKTRFRTAHVTYEFY
jgi:hypothetical protein